MTRSINTQNSLQSVLCSFWNFVCAFLCACIFVCVWWRVAALAPSPRSNTNNYSQNSALQALRITGTERHNDLTRVLCRCYRADFREIRIQEFPIREILGWEILSSLLHVPYIYWMLLRNSAQSARYCMYCVYSSVKASRLVRISRNCMWESVSGRMRKKQRESKKFSTASPLLHLLRKRSENIQIWEVTSSRVHT